MEGKRRSISRFHFLQFVPKSLFNDWGVGLSAAAVVVGGGVWFIRWVKAHDTQSGIQIAETEIGLSLFVCVISFILFMYGRACAHPGALYLLPLSRFDRAVLVGCDSAVFSFVWFLCPALGLLYFSGFAPNHLAGLVFTWFLARLVQPIGISISRVVVTYVPPEKWKWLVVLFWVMGFASMGIVLASEWLQSRLAIIAKWGVEVLFLETPLWAFAAVIGLIPPAWFLCKSACSLKIPTQKIRAKTGGSSGSTDTYLQREDVSDAAINPNSFLPFALPWTPVILSACCATLLFFLPVYYMRRIFEFIDFLGARFGIESSPTVVLVCAITPLLFCFGAIFIPGRILLRRFGLICESLRYGQLLPVDRFRIILPTLLGLGISVLVFSFMLTAIESDTEVVKHLFVVGCLTPIAGCFMMAFCMEGLKHGVPTETSRSYWDVPNLQFQFEAAPPRFLETLVGLAPFPTFFLIGYLHDGGYLHLAAISLLAVAVYSLWAMVWLWKRY